MNQDKITVTKEFLQWILNAIQPVMAYGRIGSRDVEQFELQKASVAIIDVLTNPQIAPVEYEYKHVCNLWINPASMMYEVDRCDHHPSETIEAYIRKRK